MAQRNLCCFLFGCLSCIIHFYDRLAFTSPQSKHLALAYNCWHQFGMEFYGFQIVIQIAETSFFKLIYF